MARNPASDVVSFWNRGRVLGWGAAALVLLIPLVAMRFTDEVDWEPGDFAVAALLLGGVGLAFELAVRWSRDSDYRAAAGLGLLGALLLAWVNGAVGIIGSENNDANQLYGGVLLIGGVGALLARFRSRGMAWALLATAAAQALVAAIAVALGLGGDVSGWLEIVLLNAFFVALFGASGLLFRRAAR
jgi:hypothetical protein